MSATTGMKCPECGHEAAMELRCFRPRRRWRRIAVGVLVASSSWVPFKWPEYQRLSPLGMGWLAFVPRTAVAAGWPWLLEWNIASAKQPGAWWALPNAQGYLILDNLVSPKHLWSWQEWLVMRSCARVIAESDNGTVLDQALFLGLNAPNRPAWLVDAFMHRFVDPKRGQPLWSMDKFANIELGLDRKWAPAVFTLLSNEDTFVLVDERAIYWLAQSDHPMDSLVPFLDSKRIHFTRKAALAMSLAEANITQHSRRIVFDRVTANPMYPDPLVPMHLARMDNPDASMVRRLTRGITGNEGYAAVLSCAAAARAGIPDQQLLDALQSATYATNPSVRRAAKITRAILTADDEAVRRETLALVQFLETEKDRDKRCFEVTVMLEFARMDVLPEQLSLEGLAASVDAGVNDNWFDVGRSAQHLIKIGADAQPGIHKLLLKQITMESSAGYLALEAYVERGSAPRDVIAAARTFYENLSEPQRTHCLAGLATVRPTD